MNKVIYEVFHLSVLTIVAVSHFVLRRLLFHFLNRCVP